MLYLVNVAATMLVLPVASIVVEYSMGNADLLALLGTWFVF